MGPPAVNKGHSYTETFGKHPASPNRELAANEDGRAAAECALAEARQEGAAAVVTATVARAEAAALRAERAELLQRGEQERRRAARSERVSAAAVGCIIERCLQRSAPAMGVLFSLFCQRLLPSFSVELYGRRTMMACTRDGRQLSPPLAHAPRTLFTRPRPCATHCSARSRPPLPTARACRPPWTYPAAPRQRSACGLRTLLPRPLPRLQRRGAPRQRPPRLSRRAPPRRGERGSCWQARWRC
jgi:hypothetical protein